MEYPEVSREEAKMAPYPYVYILEDGSARELAPGERKYLDTPFHPGDSARPYIKENYRSKDGAGNMSGYCPRNMLPKRLKVKE